jgi:hypothetical protein
LAKVALIAMCVLMPTIGWFGYTRYFDAMRKSIGLRERDWDRGGPLQDKHDRNKEEENKSDTEKKFYG